MAPLWIPLLLALGRPTWRITCQLQSTSTRLLSQSDPFLETLVDLGFSPSVVVEELCQARLWNEDNTSRSLLTLCRGLTAEQISDMLQKDFGVSALAAHQVRSALTCLSEATAEQPPSLSPPPPIRMTQKRPMVTGMDARDFVVNEAAVARKQRAAKSAGDAYAVNETHYPVLEQELAAFWAFMIDASTEAQEEPIRASTAAIYRKHARLFLGWYLQRHAAYSSISLEDIIPSPDKESAKPILAYLQWLRQERSISVTYEANLLRGLVKLLKFRFRHASSADPSYGDRPFADIAVIREVRMLQRSANKRQAKAPRSSNEERKWLSWPEYLVVVEACQDAVRTLLEQYHAGEYREKTTTERKIAIGMQKYLILAILASVPDRQRTIRELELGRTLVRVKDQWCIRHGPDDYKTGRTYGERPPLQLPLALTPTMDCFLNEWRPVLQPSTDFVFVQPNRGQPLTGDSVYRIVSDTCFRHAGKRTNPHLLRDMIVTHVRDSSASEKELEALALYMGHSINMQRTSYDRRTLDKKVEPAIALMTKMNAPSSDE